MSGRSATAVLAVAGVLLAGCGMGGDDRSAAPESTRTPMRMEVLGPSAGPSTPDPKPTEVASARPSPKPTARIGPEVSAAAYADDFCRAILDDRLMAAKLRKALKPQPAGDSLETMREFYVDALVGVRRAALDLANDLRRAGSPRIADGRELASDVRAAMDYVALVDAARAKLDALDADEPSAFDKAARKILAKLQTDVAAQRADIQKAPDSAAFDDAVDASAICRNL
ncbi:MAG: hypothetical protein ACT4QG_15885 [Sporichthyaceae bacterium]